MKNVRHLIVLLLLLFFQKGSFSNENLFPRQVLGFDSCAYTRYSNGLILNPAILSSPDTVSGVNISYFNQSKTDLNNGYKKTSVFLGSGLGFEQFENMGIYNKAYTGTLGLNFEPEEEFQKVFFGAAFRIYSIEESNTRTNWDMGLLYKPFSFVSLGAVAQNIREESFVTGLKMYPQYRGGIALHHNIGKKVPVIISYDKLEAADPLHSSKYFYNLSLDLNDNITLFANSTRDSAELETNTAGLTYFFGEKLLAGYNNESKNSVAGYSLVFDPTQKRIIRGTDIFGAKIAELEIAGEYEEERTFNFMFFAPRKPLFRNLLASIKSVSGRKKCGYLFITLKNNNLGFCQIKELRDALVSLRKDGKKVYVYMPDGIDPKNYFLASAADKIYTTPNSFVHLEGLSADLMFFKGLLDKVKVKADLVRPEECIYKSGIEQFTRTSASKEFKENMESVLGEFYNKVLGSISEARNINIKLLQETVDKQPLMTARQAKELNLIDNTGYLTEIKDYLAKETDTAETGKDLKMFKLLPEKNSNFWAREPRVAVIYALGGIMDGKSERQGPFSPIKIVGADTFIKKLELVKENKKIKVVVIRIDSPGGSGQASDLIWKAIEDLKADGKKVVVSMGNVAASGGYYIACNADKIVADEYTITGSIGVFGGKIVFGGLLDWAGINTETIKYGRNADMFSSNKEFTAEQKQIITAQLDDFYKNFKEKVAKGRNLSYEEVSNLAKGKIYTGQQALDAKLVDKLGGLSEALKLAGEISGVDDPENALYIEDDRGLKDLFMDSLAFSPELKLQNTFKRFENSGYVWTIMPAWIDIK
ncbi:MAG: signal peptide peptidase SppA [Elusimicrobia bacterium RIFOXYA2_FULL_39_19]|nr:MAG: signal peptide peptidase SppA [Elusimicrobia bacterium RIFOXYA2_FULL_39_19]